MAVAGAEEGVAAAAEAAGPFPHEDGKEEKSRLTREIAFSKTDDEIRRLTKT